jgi:tellurite resistance protein TehA-like permease
MGEITVFAWHILYASIIFAFVLRFTVKQNASSGSLIQTVLGLMIFGAVIAGHQVYFDREPNFN